MLLMACHLHQVLLKPANCFNLSMTYVYVCAYMQENTPRNSFYILAKQGNLMHLRYI
jgi:hypothetical protein